MGYRGSNRQRALAAIGLLCLSCTSATAASPAYVGQGFSPAFIARPAASSPSNAQQATPTAQPAQTKPQAKPAVKPKSGRAPASGPAAFDAVVAEATNARTSGRLDEALALYGKAMKLNPSWTEGHWYVGTTSYELDRYAPARDAFRRVTQLSPENGAAWTFLGLCDFQLKNYEDALGSLLKGRAAGVGANKELVGVARYHTALLLTRIENYEQALQTLWEFAREGDDGPRIIEAMGIATLRMPLLPADVPGSKRDQIMLAGRASYYTAARFNAAAQKAYEELVSRYPDTPNMHYAYGVFLTAEQPDAAIEQYKAELQISPRHPWAKMQLAFEYIKRGEYEAARPYAEQAVAEAPNMFVARRALGQVLLETGDVAGAVREYEIGVQLAPQSPAMRFALARAYRKAGRVADAQREQVEFTRLERLVRAERSGEQSVGGMEMEPASDSGPPQPQ
jgi:tetratricopeptide (TPR) repeat protein